MTATEIILTVVTLGLVGVVSYLCAGVHTLNILTQYLINENLSARKKNKVDDLSDEEIGKIIVRELNIDRDGEISFPNDEGFN